MGESLLWILWVADVLTVLLLVLAAGTSLRDEAYRQGWLTSRSRLGMMAQRSERKRTFDTLQALGLDSAVTADIRAAYADRRRRRRPKTSIGPDVAFLNVAQRWVLKLDSSVKWRESQYYLDIMGALGGRESHEQSLGQIHAEWIRKLQSAGRVAEVDLLLGPKDGNVLLCQSVAEQLQLPLILCKGEKDKSRVERPDNVPHETDFEGLRALSLAESKRSRLPGHRLVALVIDDSCSSGSQLISMATRFNQLTGNGPINDVNFSVTKDIVTLFRVRQTHTTNDRLIEAGLSVHALVAMGDPELKLLLDARRPFQGASDFKKDTFSCADSIRLLDGQPTAGLSRRVRRFWGTR